MFSGRESHISVELYTLVLLVKFFFILTLHVLLSTIFVVNYVVAYLNKVNVQRNKF